MPKLVVCKQLTCWPAAMHIATCPRPACCSIPAATRSLLTVPIGSTSGYLGCYEDPADPGAIAGHILKYPMSAHGPLMPAICEQAAFTALKAGLNVTVYGITGEDSTAQLPDAM